VKLIVGLGNPGIEYQFTPHNMGFLAVDRIAAQCGVRVGSRLCKALTGRARIAGEEVLLAKPETWMNLSGMSVRELVQEFEADPARDLLVLLDDLDLPLGTLRIRQRGSSGGHNGLESIIGALGTQEFCRLRMGIAPGHPVGDGARYVLSEFRKPQLKLVDELLDQAAEAVGVLVAEGVASAMNRFNRKVEPPAAAAAAEK
jgi:PTH1 family peptidyl-tRNA hydrolase